MTAATTKNVFIGLKHGNWYLVEDDKNFVGESTKGDIFLGTGRE